MEQVDLVAVNNDIVNTLAEEDTCTTHGVSCQGIGGKNRIAKEGSHVDTVHRAVLNHAILHDEVALALVTDAVKRGIDDLAVCYDVVLGMRIIGHIQPGRI